MRRDVLCVDKPVECGVGVLLHGGLGGMLADAVTVAAVVEEEDVEAGVVECAVRGEERRTMEPSAPWRKRVRWGRRVDVGMG